MSAVNEIINEPKGEEKQHMRSSSEWERREQEHNSPRAALIHVSWQIVGLLQEQVKELTQINVQRMEESDSPISVQKQHMGYSEFFGTQGIPQLVRNMTGGGLNPRSKMDRRAGSSTQLPLSIDGYLIYKVQLPISSCSVGKKSSVNQVNGKDISRASLQEVLEILQSTGEQITLEVHQQKSAQKPPRTSDAATQTDFRAGNEQCRKEENCSTSGLNLCLDGAFFDYLLPQDCNSDNGSNYPLPAPCATGKEALNSKALALLHQDELSFSSCYSIPAALSSVSGSLAEGKSSKGKEEKQAFLHPEWDSGLGFTDTSTQPGENSGPDAGAEPARGQEGPSADLCTSTPARRGLLTDDFPTYDELSDSSFCGVSAEECRRFQELLESRCSQYRPISREEEMPHGSGGREEGCKQCKQDQWLPKCLQVDENSTPREKGLQHRAELCLQSTASGDGNKASENKPSAQAIAVCPQVTTGSKELTIPHHTHQYRGYMSLLQEKAAAEHLSDPARVPANPRRCSGSPEGRAGDDGNRWRLACERSKWSLKKQHKNWLLKDRALRITEERSGLTTDEDALSELKTGKYWNKAQRKQHMLLAKEQKPRKALQSQRAQPSEDKASTEHRRNFSIVELSQKKLMKNRNRKILDNWITIQELLTHGTRTPDGRQTYSPLLSVTAV